MQTSLNPAKALPAIFKPASLINWLKAFSRRIFKPSLHRDLAGILGLLLPLLTCTGLLLSGCADSTRCEKGKELKQWLSQDGKVKVLSTTGMIDDLVRRIGGDHIDAITLIGASLNPHTYQLVKGDSEKLAFAQVIFYNGLGLEHGPNLQHYLANDAKALALGDQIARKYPHEIITINKQADPHIWMDIAIWMKGIPLIVERLSQQDPQHAEIYKSNGVALTEEMQQADAFIRQELHDIPAHKRFLVTSHDAFNYFARSYLAEPGEIHVVDWQKRFMAPEGLSPDSQINPQDIRNLISHLAQYNIHVLFSESNVSKDSIRKIQQAGQEEGLQIVISPHALYADAMGQACSPGDTYLKMMTHNAKTISQMLK